MTTGATSCAGPAISAVPASIYLHYALALWIHKSWQARKAKGRAIIVRNLDGFADGFQHKRDAEQFLFDVRERPGRFGLEVHAEMTRPIEFGRFAMANCKARDDRRRLPISSLRTIAERRKADNLGRMPISSRVVLTLVRIMEAMRYRMHHDKRDAAEWLLLVVGGWMIYCGVPAASRSLASFVFRLDRMRTEALRRRSQKGGASYASVDFPA